MWIFLSDAFFSIVKKDCAADELMVRARRPGDIEKVFNVSNVEDSTMGDYRYRAAVKTSDVVRAMTLEIESVHYDNFKNSIGDDDLLKCCMEVWHHTAAMQPTPPYHGHRRRRKRR